MPMNWNLEKGNTGVFHVSGKLAKQELEHAQNACEDVIKKIGNIKLLVILDNFAGWEEAEGWEDTSFAERNDQYIDKIAIVGDEKWRDMAYLFTLKGLRPVAIEFFKPDQEANARVWLNDVL